MNSLIRELISYSKKDKNIWKIFKEILDNSLNYLFQNGYNQLTFSCLEILIDEKRKIENEDLLIFSKSNNNNNSNSKNAIILEDFITEPLAFDKISRLVDFRSFSIQNPNQMIIENPKIFENELGINWIVYLCKIIYERKGQKELSQFISQNIQKLQKKIPDIKMDKLASCEFNYKIDIPNIKGISLVEHFQK
ncbi:hypothetical protein M0811_12885 [Anaeramoeba ignava]|uniref:Uncharacterized protein n=1 Tax=Anaeramoeba ignava TaxID=1746090 RepID=A0A9Q0L7J9_ANAIG|nr:hypothetical protein M0811_12885 [Anaeramoeba ignava]